MAGKDITVGDAWDAKIKAKLQECEWFIPLVSLSFLNSRYITETELPLAVRRLDAKTDADVFRDLGRSTEIDACTQLLLTSSTRHTLLHGVSGAGKTA